MNLEAPLEAVRAEGQPARRQRPIDDGQEAVAEDQQQRALKERHRPRSAVNRAASTPATEPMRIGGAQTYVQYTPAIGQMFDACSSAATHTPTNTPPARLAAVRTTCRTDGRSANTNAAGSSTSHFEALSM